MAKTRLIAAAERAMSDLADQMDAIDKIFESFGDFEESDFQKMNARYNAAQAALKALGAHLENLRRRQSDEAKVADKLRNLKNIFKNKQELAARRKAARDKFDALQKRLDRIHVNIEETKNVVQIAREHYASG